MFEHAKVVLIQEPSRSHSKSNRGEGQLLLADHMQRELGNCVVAENILRLHECRQSLDLRTDHDPYPD
jgi:hypothetical protein